MARTANNRDFVTSEIYRLEQMYGSLKVKWLRDYFLYENSIMLDLDSMTDESVNGFYNNGCFEVEEDTTIAIQENIVRSCISTLVSKIASQKGRAVFTTVNGTYKDYQLAKQAQVYFDNIYDEKKVHKTITEVFKDACIFNRGVVFIDKYTSEIRRVMPWQVFIDPREYSYGSMTRAAWKQTQFPVALLNIKVDNENLRYVTKYNYWDINKHIEVTYIPELDYYSEQRYDNEILPFVFMFYESPIKGTNNQSAVDMLMGIQLEINALLVKIKDASQLSPAMTYFVPEESSIKTSKLSNRTGEVVTYTANPNIVGNNPITVATPAFIDPQYIQLLDKFKQDAADLIGISDLSRAGKKPAGLNSGVGLSTLEAIEDSRHESQLDQVIRLYTDIARACIKLFPPEAEVLPQSQYRMQITWADIVEASGHMNLQFSVAEWLSRDPSVKLQQIQQLYAAGLITQNRIASLLSIPDIDGANNLMTNALNSCLAVINDCIEHDNYDIPEYVLSTGMLQEEILNTCLSLRAANNPANAADIAKLMKLYSLCDAKEVDSMASAEMAAVSQLQQELSADMSDPNGQINSAVNNAVQNGLQNNMPQ